MHGTSRRRSFAGEERTSDGSRPVPSLVDRSQEAESRLQRELLMPAQVLKQPCCGILRVKLEGTNCAAFSGTGMGHVGGPHHQIPPGCQGSALRGRGVIPLTRDSVSPARTSPRSAVSWLQSHKPSPSTRQRGSLCHDGFPSRSMRVHRVTAFPPPL